MYTVDTRVLAVLTFLVLAISCSDNVTEDMPLHKETKPSGALSSLGRMFIDIPLGIVEAFKDAAEAIESVVIAIVRGVFA